jgi:hypothetical protein
VIQLGKTRSSSIVSKSKVDNSKANDKWADAVGMCSGSGRLAADADEEGGPARETRVTVAVTAESSRVVFMAYGIVSDPSRVSDVPVVHMRDVWVCVCVCVVCWPASGVLVAVLASKSAPYCICLFVCRP